MQAMTVQHQSQERSLGFQEARFQFPTMPAIVISERRGGGGVCYRPPDHSYGTRRSESNIPPEELGTRLYLCEITGYGCGVTEVAETKPVQS